MSMNAVFVQVNGEALKRIEADPSLAETLFMDQPLIPPQFAKMSEVLQQRMRSMGPQLMAKTLEALDPRVRERLEQQLGRSAESFATGAGGDELIKVMQERAQRSASRQVAAGTKLSLDKEWHGVHYLLCGEVEPGKSLLSKAVMGGKDLGEDDEGFSGYGPARCFPAKEVAEISAALSAAEVEAQAEARFDAAKMTTLGIYPGFRPSDAEPLMDAMRKLRDFYADAAGKGMGIVTCLV